MSPRNALALPVIDPRAHQRGDQRSHQRANQAPVRVAMLPRGVDGVYLPRMSGYEIAPLVLRGSPEEAWMASLYGSDQLLRYELARDDLGPYPATEALLVHSDIDEAMGRADCDALFLSAACTPITRAWAERRRVRLLATDYEHQRRFEHKLWFDAFLRRHGLPRPAGGPMVLGPRARLPVPGRAAVQDPESMGGEGTWLVTGADEVDRLADAEVLRRGARYLVREFIVGRPFGITVFVAPSTVALSAVRLQCYYPQASAPTCSGRVFAGVQWVPTRHLTPELRRRLDETFLKLGELLYRRRFFGYANVDFMVDERDGIHILECNPRMSAATPELLREPELMGGVAAGELFLRHALSPRSYPASYSRSPLPDSNYRGATLDLVAATSGELITRQLASGRYSINQGAVSRIGDEVRSPAGTHELDLFAIARAGQSAEAGDTLATIVSGGALYDDGGALLPAAHELLAAFS